MWTQYISLIFLLSLDLLDHIKAGPFSTLVCLHPFGINMVQTSSCRRGWTTTSSNSRFSAWSQTLSSSSSPESPHGQQNTRGNQLVRRTDFTFDHNEDCS